MQNYTIKKIDRVEFDLLVPLMKDCFGIDVNIEYFNWKYLKNPSGSFIGFIAIDEKGEIGAYYGVIPELFLINGVERIIFQSCDTMTHSAHRRRGLFKMLAEHCYNYLKEIDNCHIYGFGGTESTPGFIKFGWENISRIKYYFLPKQFNLFYIFSNIDNVISINPLELISQIEKTNSSPNFFQPLLNKDIIKWRMSNPLRQYHAKVNISEDGTIKAYVIFEKQHDKFFIFNFGYEVLADFKKIIKSLLIECKTNNSKGIISFCQENSSFSSKLLKAGFLNNPFSFGPLSEKNPFIVYSQSDKLSDFNKPEKWNVNPFYHDAL